MLQVWITSVLQVKNRDELLAEVVASRGGWGFETVSAMAVVDH
jgi:hypothetical protein